MSGITVGPRQFTLMKDCCSIKMRDPPALPDSINSGGSDWVFRGGGKYVTNQTKLDLRPFYQANTTRALDFLNITLQESPLWMNSSDELGLLVTDILSTVRLSNATLQRNYEIQTSGFLNSGVPDENIVGQRINPSQVVWGLWRHFDHDINLSRALVTRGSSFFGEGEIVVAPALYWTRIVSMFKAVEGSEMYIPSANLVCHAAAIDISEGQEMSQMSRMAQS